MCPIVSSRIPPSVVSRFHGYPPCQARQGRPKATEECPIENLRAHRNKKYDALYDALAQDNPIGIGQNDTQVASSQLAPTIQQTPTESRLLPICRPRETPAPQVIVQSDPNVGRALQSIEFKLERIVSNTTPPARPIEPARQADDVSPLAAALVVLGCVVLGFVIYFSAQKG